MVIDKQGCLTKPLYHGTSDLIFEKIRETGLGGVNLLDDLDAWVAYEELWNIYVSDNLACDAIECERCMYEKMASQSPTGSLNMQHGQVYVCASKVTAARYAQHSCGSEYLSNLLTVYRAVHAHDPKTGNDWGQHKAIQFCLRAHQPVLVKILPGIHKDVLLTEHAGGDVTATLESWQSHLTKDPYMQELLLQGVGFRIKGIVPPDQLEVCA